jgi:DNA-directed RNA polymerase alpha subunit
MQNITAPYQPNYTELGANHGKLEIGGCYPGYGATLGNALRRILLSSLPGYEPHALSHVPPQCLYPADLFPYF